MASSGVTLFPSQRLPGLTARELPNLFHGHRPGRKVEVGNAVRKTRESWLGGGECARAMGRQNPFMGRQRASINVTNNVSFFLWSRVVATRISVPASELDPIRSRRQERKAKKEEEAPERIARPTPRSVGGCSTTELQDRKGTGCGGSLSADRSAFLLSHATQGGQKKSFFAPSPRPPNDPQIRGFYPATALPSSFNVACRSRSVVRKHFSENDRRREARASQGGGGRR